MRRSACLAVVLVSACTGLPPLRQHFEVGRDPYVIFVADAPDGRGDLWAMSPDGGDVVQLTYSLPAEWSPRLSPGGDVVVFLRARAQGDTTRSRVWLLNLLNGSERAIQLPDSAGAPVAIAWTDGGRGLFIRTTRTTFHVDAPPFPPDAVEVPSGDRAAAARALSVRVGSPAFASVAPCQGSDSLCVYPDSGAPAAIAGHATDPARWGNDSLSYSVQDALVIRPLGPGRERLLRWRPLLVHPRDVTVFTGSR